MSWGPDLQDKIPNAEKPEAGWCGGWEHQEARLEILPPLDEEPGHPAVLVVPVSESDSGAPLQSVSGVEVPGPLGR